MKAVVLIPCVLLAGCTSILGIGDLHPAGGDGGPADAAPGAIDAAPLPIRAVAVGTDYSHPGHAAAIDVRAAAVTKDIAPGLIGKDPILRHYGHEVLVVNRFGLDQIVVLDDASHVVIGTFVLPAASNIQDVAAAGTKLYVPALASTGVLVVDRDTKAVKTIALLQTVDPDLHPDCVSAFYTGTRVYVACGILDANFAPRGPGKIVAIDPFNDTVVATIDLPYPNPLGQLMPTQPATPAAGALTIGTVPSFTDFSTGCLARVKLTTPETADCLITNQSLGGGANHAAADPTGKTLWIASTLYTPTTLEPYGRLVGFDLGAGQLAAPVSEPGRPVVDLAACGDGFVIATERGQNENGARIYHDGPGGPLLDLGDIPVVAGGIVCY